MITLGQTIPNHINRMITLVSIQIIRNTLRGRVVDKVSPNITRGERGGGQKYHATIFIGYLISLVEVNNILWGADDDKSHLYTRYVSVQRDYRQIKNRKLLKSKNIFSRRN